MIIWRGWGYLILLVPIFFWIVLVVAMASWGYYEPDREKATAMVYRTFAAGCGLGVLVLWPIVHYRSRSAPGVDHLAFIPMRYWLPIVAAAALVATIASFFPAALGIF
jgi:hypothetical protein